MVSKLKQIQKAHLSFCNPKTNNHNQQMNQACFKTARRRLSSRKQNPNLSLGYCYCCSSCGFSSPPTSSFALIFFLLGQD
jgi:hypothetical protein